MVQIKGIRSNRRSAPDTTWRRIEHDSDTSSLQDAPYPAIWLGTLHIWKRIAVLAAIAAVYFAVGKAGFTLGHNNVGMFLIWPATGFALATLLLFGQNVWPAIAAGAFVLSVTTSGLFLPALGIAAGQALEAFAGAWMVRRWANGWRAFERYQDILRFALLAGFAATLISATLGTTSLCLAGLGDWASYFSLWSNWWLADTVGAVIITPVIILLVTQPRPHWPANLWLEACLLFGGLFLVSAILFGGLFFQVSDNYPLTFLYIPFLFWTAFRFGPREAALATLLISALAIGSTVHGQGRFAALPSGQPLILAQAFLGVVALTTLGVAANVSENRRLEALAAQLAAIVESSYDAIIGETVHGTIVSWNQGAERMYGYTAGEAIGKPIAMLSPLQSSDEVPQVLQKIRREEAIEPYETVRRRKDGSLVDISLAVSPVRDTHGRVVAASAIARDITEQKRTEAQLVEANDKLKGWLNQLERETQEITLLNQMSHLLQTAVSENEIGGVVKQFAHKLFPGDSGAVCVRGGSADLVETICAWGTHPPSEQVFNRRDCWALRHGQIHTVTNTQIDIICPHWTEGPWPANSLCVPMMAQGDSLGVLLLRRPAVLPMETGAMQTRFSISREQLAVNVASHIALALSNLRLRESLRVQSVRDTLTGLYNRRYLNEVLEREVRRAARGQRHLAVVMVDVDGFKGINDTYGHEAGDTFLRELGTFLQKRVREEDVACRYGGDEFVILLTETSLETARRRAKQLRDGIKTLALPYRGQYLTPPSVSMGAALYPEHGSSADELIRAADDALYRAKARGRDCLVISNAGGSGGEARERVS